MIRAIGPTHVKEMRHVLYMQAHGVGDENEWDSLGTGPDWYPTADTELQTEGTQNGIHTGTTITNRIDTGTTVIPHLLRIQRLGHRLPRRRLLPLQ